MEWSYSEDRKRIVLDKPPVQKLRITGTRLGSVLGVNKYSTPFKAWCEITKLVKAPFEDSKYMKFGRAVEPKLIEYVGKFYPNVMSIKDYYGNNFEEYQWNNFKDESNIMGGIIDAVATRNDGKTLATIIECKTASNASLWTNNSVPVSYLLQGALYAYLKGLDRVVFVCTFPEEMDYNHPENYQVTDENTILVVKKLSDILIPINGKYLNIEECMEYATEWWNEFVVQGISPEFDEKLDKDYLDIIRASKPCEDNELIDVCNEAIQLAKEIKELEVSSGLKAKQDLLKVLEASIKETMIEQQLNQSGKYKLSEKKKIKFDEKRLEKENPKVYNQYMIEEISYTLSKNLKEEE